MKKAVTKRKTKKSSHTSSDDEDLVFRWKGKGVKKNNLTFYEVLTHGNDSFQIGDAVELTSSGTQPSLIGEYKKSWIAEIEALWETEDGEKWMECRWYYAINDLAPSSRPCYRRRELFETDHISNNEVESISQKVTILSYDDWTLLSEEERDFTFFCDQFYSYKTCYLRPILDHSPEKKLERIHIYSYQHTELPDELAPSKRKRSASASGSAGSARSSTSTSAAKRGRVEDKMEIAKEHLMLSHVPARIPCRENERKQIIDYLKNSILQKGNGSPLYISGMPGTGKTATVREVIRDLKKKYSFNYLEINGMKVTSANSVFSIILNYITHKYVVSSKASELLNDYFTKPKRKSDKVLVILADELDYLFTKSQQIIYKLFDWPNEKNSQLVVIGISNTIDLPERIMNLRNVSRLSMNRVMFKPYTRDQITTIINDRLNELSVFTPEAIDLCSRKVSSISGDIRRALSIARRGVELACERGLDKVPIGIIAEASREHSESYKMNLLRHCSLYQQLLLISIVLHMNAIGVDFVLVTDIYARMNTLVMRYAKKDLLFPELQATLASIASIGIISIIPPSTKYDTLIKLNVQPDDICFALKDNDIAKIELSLLL